MSRLDLAMDRGRTLSFLILEAIRYGCGLFLMPYFVYRVTGSRELVMAAVSLVAYIELSIDKVNS